MNDADIQVGPAQVVAIEADGRARVRTMCGACATVVADWAIPFRYQPEPGDLLLVIGGNGRFWVTGVVHGRGRSTLAFRGDLTVHAAAGLRLGGDGGLRLDAPTIRIETAALESECEQTVQRLGELDAEVVGTHDERSGECSRVVDETDEVVAARCETIAAKAVRIDGGLLRIS